MRSLTQPFVDDVDHSILDIRTAVVVVRVVERLEDLVDNTVGVLIVVPGLRGIIINKGVRGAR